MSRPRILLLVLAVGLLLGLVTAPAGAAVRPSPFGVSGVSARSVPAVALLPAVGAPSAGASAAGVPAVQAFRNGRWAQQPEPGGAGIVFTVNRNQITRLSMITSSICTERDGSDVYIDSILVAGAGAPIITMPPNGRASDTAPFSDAGQPGTMTYTIRLRGSHGTARFHLELEKPTATCVTDPVFLNLRRGH